MHNLPIVNGAELAVVGLGTFPAEWIFSGSRAFEGKVCRWRPELVQPARGQIPEVAVALFETSLWHTAGETLVEPLRGGNFDKPIIVDRLFLEYLVERRSPSGRTPQRAAVVAVECVKIQVVDQHGGRIEIQSKVGSGTSVYLYFQNHPSGLSQ